MSARRKKDDIDSETIDEAAEVVVEEPDQPQRDETTRGDAEEPVEAEAGPFDATTEATRAVDEAIGDASVMPRRRAYAIVLHTADISAARKVVPLSDNARAALRIGEP